jgi:DNA-binding NtrC family response regulator
LIRRILNQTHGNKRKTAEILKIDYTTLFEKLKKYGLQSSRQVLDEESGVLAAAGDFPGNE